MNTELKSKISFIMSLKYTDNEEVFKAGFETLIKPYFKKNLPSLFKEIQVLYSSE